MYDIKTLEFGQQQQQQQQQKEKAQNYYKQPKYDKSCSIITNLQNSYNNNNNNRSNSNWLFTNAAAQLDNQLHTHLQSACSLPTTTTTTTTSIAAATTAQSNSLNSSNNNKSHYSSCSVLTPLTFTTAHNSNTNNTSSNSTFAPTPTNPAETTHMTLLSLRRRRLFQRQACLLSILAAFIFGLALGVFMPMFGLANVFGTLSTSAEVAGLPQMLPIVTRDSLHSQEHNVNVNRTRLVAHPPSDFPTIYEMHAADISATATASASADDINPFSVAFIKENDVTLTAEQVFRNAFHLEQDKQAPNALIVKKIDADDGSIKEFRVQRLTDGRFRKGPERRLTKATLAEQVLQNANDFAMATPQLQQQQQSHSQLSHATADMNAMPLAQHILENARSEHNNGIIKADIYWGDLVERALPKGFTAQDAKNWNAYVTMQGVVERLETGCGRMQNRLVVFADGTRACARYRQNTDQIQGELFSFYLGQLLNLSNLAPSAASVIDLETSTWSSAIGDITQSQWRSQRPVVLTRWLPDLEPAGIPQPFRPLERHLNKYDVWNITLGAAAEMLRGNAALAAAAATNADAPNQMSVENQKGLLKRLEAASSAMHDHQSATLESSAAAVAAIAAASHSSSFSASSSSSISTSDRMLAAALNATQTSASTTSVVLQRLIELAQWSDLIVFDYLIANLDRVVNNLYNFQWNADIMAAPAHNLARQSNTQLLVFLDNESGLLHGYRLLKKYEAYHGLLLDNLCVFRQPTIEALRQLREYGAGRKLRELFEQTTNAGVRDVLPSLPDKSIKILVDRIDRVLGQVQKCRDLLADR